MLNTTSNQTNLAGERVMEWYIHVVSALIATICLAAYNKYAQNRKIRKQLEQTRYKINMLNAQADFDLAEGRL